MKNLPNTLNNFQDEPIDFVRMFIRSIVRTKMNHRCLTVDSTSSLLWRRRWSVGVWLLIVGFYVPSLQAADSAKPTSQLTAYKRVLTKDSKGVTTESLVNFTKIFPGDEVVYVVRTANPGSQAVSDVTVVLPIPKEMTYIAGTAEDPSALVTFSIDGGKRFASLSKLVVVSNKGFSRPAVLTDITHVRWVITQAIPPGKTTEVRCRAILK